MISHLHMQPPPAYPSMRIGLLGGSFNPAHEGHVHISLAAIERLQLHKLWWMVTPGNPLKRHSELASLEDRLACARKLATHPKIEVTDFEASLPSPYASDTVDFLTRRYPGVRFVWIMGGDNLAQFHRWRNWARLFAAIPILIADRPSSRYKALASPAAQRFAGARLNEAAVGCLPYSKPPAWVYLTLPLCAVSSTAIRQNAGAQDIA